MRRVTIQEAASCLDVNEDVIKTRIKEGSLVACQDPEHRGYIWLKEPDLPSMGPRNGSKSNNGAGTKDAPRHEQTEQSGSNGQEGGPPEDAPAPRPRSAGRKSRSSQRSQGSAALVEDRQAGPPEDTPAPEPPSGKRKSRSRQGAHGSEVPMVDGEEGPQEDTPEPEAQTPGRKSRTSQRAQEVELLRETVAMLKEELGRRDRQLELKEAEIQARRDEVKELLAVLRQPPARPTVRAPRREEPDSIIMKIQVAYVLLIEMVGDITRELASRCSRVILRNKERKSAGEQG